MRAVWDRPPVDRLPSCCRAGFLGLPDGGRRWWCWGYPAAANGRLLPSSFLALGRAVCDGRGMGREESEKAEAEGWWVDL